LSNSKTVVRQLIVARETALKNSKGWKEEAAKIDAQISEIISPEAILREAGKLEDGGSKTVEIDGGKFNIGADKKIKWDSAMLQAVAAKMDWETVSNLFKIKFEMPEAKYKAALGLLPADVVTQINEARTVEVGEAKIKKVELLED